ncbi:hypothetical protein BGZ73_001991 [Actinomortierella ambigua]|nr:hypothetical protein BGZ73_001991 [Actinomortierella ambigua]
MKRFLLRMKSKEDLAETSSSSGTSNSTSAPVASDPPSPMLPRHNFLTPVLDNRSSRLPSLPSSAEGSAEGSTPGTLLSLSTALGKSQGLLVGEENEHETHVPRTVDTAAAGRPFNASIRSSSSSTSIYREASSSLEDLGTGGDSGSVIWTRSVHATRPTNSIHMADFYMLPHIQSEVASMVYVPVTASEAPILGDIIASSPAHSSPIMAHTSVAPSTQTTPHTLSSPINEHPFTPEFASDSDQSTEHRARDTKGILDYAAHTLSANSSIQLSSNSIVAVPLQSSSNDTEMASSTAFFPSLKSVHYGVDAFQLLRNLFNNPLYSDLTLVVGDSQFYVHRGLLAQQSGYFQDLFVARRAQDPAVYMRHLDMTQGPVLFSRSSIWVHEKPASNHEGDQKCDDSPSDPCRTREKCKVLTPSSSSVEENGVNTSDALSDEAQVQSAAATAFSSMETTEPQPLPPALTPSTATSWPIDMETLTKSSFPARHFGLFLALIYGVQTAHQLAFDDILPVLHTTHAFRGPTRLQTSLAHCLIERHHQHHYRASSPSPTLTSSGERNTSKSNPTHASTLRGKHSHHNTTPFVTADCWPSLIRFADHYGLSTVRHWAIAWASHDRRLWNTAVGCLDLEDYKLFLRGIRNEPAQVKNDLLLVFLAYHYQELDRERDRSASSAAATSIADLSDVATVTTTDPSPAISSSSPPSTSSPSLCSVTPFGIQYADDHPTFVSSSPLGHRHSVASTNRGSNVGHTPSLRSHSNTNYHHHHHLHRFHHTASSPAILSPLQQLSRVRSIRSLRMSRVDRAKAWMRRLKVECECDDDKTVLD